MTVVVGHDVASGGEDHRWWSMYMLWVGRHHGQHDGRTIMRADTGGHKQQPLITAGDVTILQHFVK